jgi:thioesterase domain-containing protein
LLASRLFARIEKELGGHLPLGVLFEAPTIEKLAEVLREGRSTSSALIQVQPGASTRPPIFFVQARIGYHALAAELGLDQPVYVIPTDDLFLSDTDRKVGDITAELTQRLRQHQPHGPYYLGGWCLAGRVAFAIAHELRRQGEEVALLVIIDMPAPPVARLSWAAGIRNFGAQLRWHTEYLWNGDRAQKAEWTVGAVRALRWQAGYRTWRVARSFFRHCGQSLPKSLRHPTRLMAEAMRDDTSKTYPGRITLFRPTEKSFNRYDCSDLGWGQVATGGVEVHEIPGLKRTLLRANAREVGRRLKKCLAHSSGVAQDRNHS